MNGFRDSSGRFAFLRRQAELLLQQETDEGRPLSGAESLAGILHEFEVQYIELQLQNEELLRIQHELQKTREDYFELYDQAPVGYLTLNSARIITRANLAAASLLNTERQFIINRGFSPFVGQEDHARFFALFQEGDEAGCARSCEVDLLLPGGAAVHVKLECAALHLEGSSDKEYNLTITDITALRQAYDGLEKKVEESTAELRSAYLQLQISEEKYRTVAGYASDWEYLINEQGKYLYISPSCEKISGYTPQEFEADPNLFLAIVHPDDRGMVAKHLSEEFFDSSLQKFDFRVITRSGEMKWLCHICQPVYNARGEFAGRRASNRNISYLKGMEEQLVRSEERLRLALDASSDGVWERNLATNENFYGANWFRLLGYSDHEVARRSLSWEDFLHPDDRARTLQRIEEHLAGHTGSYEAEFRMRNKGGEWQWILSRGKVVDWDEGGRPLRFVGTHTDITYRKNFELELQKAHDELEKKVKERTKELEETNVALEVLLKKRQDDRIALEQQILGNIATLVEPYLDKLASGPLTKGQGNLISILRTNLHEVISPFAGSVSAKLTSLTPAEIQVANLIVRGKRTKDVAELLNLSPGTISIHRKNIRKKLGLTNQEANLRSVLSASLQLLP
ncbi:MAG: PAS domain-containing protein [Deltaproteobacteria bacterium]|nr:PAS domain-containing protein [Deltaproteobacteria bacterium]